MPRLIVGLGNPGAKYENTKHNIGFEVIDNFAKSRQWNFKKKFKGQLAEGNVGEGAVLLLKPQTYMNLSGESVLDAVQFYKIDFAVDMMVVVDDMDLPSGKLRVRKTGGSGGHNGLKSIIELLGSESFPRLRVGIGRPEGEDARDHVLGTLAGDSRKAMDLAVKESVGALESWLSLGIEATMNRVNLRKE